MTQALTVHRIGGVVVGSLGVGLTVAVLLLALPASGARENVVSGVVLLGFALGWGLLAGISVRWTDQPQRWAAVPAALMGFAGGGLLIWRGRSCRRSARMGLAAGNARARAVDAQSRPATTS